jgi:Ca2+-binding EF-hand superfamily protein
MSPIASVPHPPRQELESLRRAFKRMNKACNGKLSVEDLLQELDFLGHKVLAKTNYFRTPPTVLF